LSGFATAALFGAEIARLRSNKLFVVLGKTTLITRRLRKKGRSAMSDNHQNGGNGSAPELIAYHVPDRRNAPWVRIGAAWPHKKGVGYSVKVEMIPLDMLRTGELVIQLRQPEAKPENGQDR
jgi:hypothetical protein